MPLTMRPRRLYNEHDEAVFLQQQAADAKVAIRHTLATMQETAKAAADVQAWTRRYPGYAVGVAAVIGFVTATTVLAPSPRNSPPAPPTAAPAARSSFLSTLLSSGFGLVRSAVMSAIISAIHAHEEHEEDRFDSA
jgi:hypothetical protein